MAEEEKEKQEEAPAKAKGKKKLLMIIVAAAVVILGAGGFFVMKGSAPSGGEAHAEAADDGGHGGSRGEKSGGGHGEKGDEGGSPYVKLSPFIVNLQDNSGTRYLKVTVNLELDHASSSSELETHKAKVRDSLIILLSSKSYSEIGTVEGKYRLRDEIVRRVNQFLGGGKVKTAYFTEFVIQ